MPAGTENNEVGELFLEPWNMWCVGWKASGIEHWKACESSEQAERYAAGLKAQGFLAMNYWKL